LEFSDARVGHCPRTIVATSGPPGLFSRPIPPIVLAPSSVVKQDNKSPRASDAERGRVPRAAAFSLARNLANIFHPARQNSNDAHRILLRSRLGRSVLAPQCDPNGGSAVTDPAASR
jgi:hypothetical protein